MGGELTRADVMVWSGRTVRGPDGRSVGRLKDVFYDGRTGEPAWGLVRRGLVFKRESVVPVPGFEAVNRRTMRVPWTRRQVAHAPKIEVHGSLTRDEEEQLCRHFGVEKCHVSGEAPQ